MTNPYIEYYTSQAGSGISGFEGVRYQKGHGFWSSLVKFIAPVAKFIGKHALRAGVHAAGDVIDRGMSIKEAAKRQLIEEGKVVGSEIISKLTGQQQGSGLRKRKKVIKRRKGKTSVPKQKKLIRRRRKRKSPRNRSYLF